ncbi:hypothetical protein [Aphanothece hegewaldii]|nr:hypothetical protein [Aphanothece hegewaldii]
MSLKIVSVKKQKAVEPVQVEPKEEIVTKPQDEAPPQTASEPETTGEEQPVFFQAIGMIEADTVKLVDKRLVITLPKARGAAEDSSQEYRGWVEPKQFRSFMRFLEEHKEGSIYLKVYPKTFMSPQHPLALQGWQIIAWRKDLPPTEKVNQFTLKGVWQFVPQSKAPVITVYRNYIANDPTGKYKATHLPILMKREDYKPFRFNPKATEQGKRYFIQGLFKFDSVRNCFLWKEDLASPTEKIPHYRKPCKVPLEETAQKPEQASKSFKKSEQSITTQVEEQIIMLNGKTPELTIKFSEKPEISNIGKTVNLQITGENGIVVKAQIARKNLTKQVEKMESFSSWIAVLSGKIVAIAPDGIVELEGAGINVFEKKAKEEAG